MLIRLYARLEKSDFRYANLLNRYDEHQSVLAFVLTDAILLLVASVVYAAG